MELIQTEVLQLQPAAIKSPVEPEEVEKVDPLLTPHPQPQDKDKHINLELINQELEELIKVELIKAELETQQEEQQLDMEEPLHHTHHHLE